MYFLLLASCLYVVGVAMVYAGKLAPFSLLLVVSISILGGL